MFCRQFDCDVRASRGLIRLLRLLAQLGPGGQDTLLICSHSHAPSSPAQLRLLPHLLPRWSSGSIFQWWTPSGRGLPGRGAHGPGGHEGVCLLFHENEVAPHQVLSLTGQQGDKSGPFGCSPVWRKEFEEFRGDDDHRQVQSLLLRGIVRGRLQDKISIQENPLIELI